MSKRLWKVRVERRAEFEMVVAADDEEGAIAVADANAALAEDDYLIDDYYFIGFAEEVQEKDDVAEEELDCEPYGDDSGRTIKEWFHGESREVRAPEHFAPFCGGVWRLDDPWVVCDNCGASAPASLANLDAAWAENDGRPGSASALSP